MEIDTPMQILHLEDDSPLREVLKFVLTTSEPDAQIHQFFSSDDALSFIQANKEVIDLFILDIRVPGDLKRHRAGRQNSGTGLRSARLW
jgi:DNA-binding response OmpR family regulator